MMYGKKGILIAVCLLIFTVGCGTDDTVYLSQSATEQMEGVSEAGNAGTAANLPGSAGTTAGVSGNARSNATTKASENARNAGATAKAGENAESAEIMAEAGGNAESAGTTAGEAVEEQQETCCVYVCGAVLTPGVYVLEAGARIYEAIEMAGGLTENAGLTAVNQAQEICDGQMIYVPTKEEVAAYPVDALAAADGAAGQTKKTAGEQDADGRVNLNTASEAELMTLSGIGQSKAQAILLYRETHGGFSSVEEIMNVDGIKEGSYNRIKDSIKVK